MQRTHEFLRTEFGKELGPLWLDVESFLAAGRQLSGSPFGRADLDAILDMQFQEATYDEALHLAPPGYQTGSALNYWIAEDGFFVRIDSVDRSRSGVDVVVSTAAMEYRPPTQMRSVPLPVISKGQVRYSFSCREGKCARTHVDLVIVALGQEGASRTCIQASAPFYSGPDSLVAALAEGSYAAPGLVSASLWLRTGEHLPQPQLELVAYGGGTA